MPMKPDPSLTVCTKCGWYNGFTHAHECDPPASKVAARLEAELADAPSTRFGYGHHKLTFVFDELCHVTFDIRASGRLPISAERIWCIDGMAHEDAVDLVRTIAAWRDRTHARRASKRKGA
jgi:hypothetical protein